MRITYQIAREAGVVDLERYRSYFASFVLSYAGVSDERLWSAFALTPRERFAGPAPWRVYTPSGWLQSPTNNPTFLYQDITIALREEGDLPSGRPTVHATCLQALAPSEGETVAHVGCGAGYYTAILAHLVGPAGAVSAFEILDDVAARAARNLADLAQVRVFHRSGTEGPFPTCHVIYVNAGATEIPTVWLDALHIGGRLLFPLTPQEGLGGMLLIARVDEQKYSARFIYQVTAAPCIGARDEQSARRLSEDFRRGNLESVKSLRRGAEPHGRVWCRGNGWWLSQDPP
jgi:protein-L-isoaspartate(D-aspartate) O-methyltransferase